MTQKLLLRATALMCAVLLGMTLHAQVKKLNESTFVDEICSPLAKPNPNLIFSSYSNSKPVGAQSKANPAQETTIMATVTIDLDYDSEQLDLLNGYFIDCNNHDVTLIRESGALPAGIYDIVYVFYDLNYRLYVVVNEQCSVNGDFTLAVSPSQATHHVTTKCYGPDGELLKLPLGHMDENGLVVVDEDSEIQLAGVTNYIFVEGCTTAIFTFMKSCSGPQYEEKRNFPLDFYVNDVSDRILFTQVKQAHTTDLSKSYCCYFSTTQVTSDQELVNDPNDYVSQDYTYKFAPYGSQQTGYGFANAINIWIETGGMEKTTTGEFILGKPSGDYKHELWMNVPYTDPNRPDLNVTIYTDFADYGEEYTVSLGEWEWQDMKLAGYTIGPALRVKDGLTQFTNWGHMKNDSQMVMGWESFSDFYYTVNEDNEWPFAWVRSAPEPLTYPTDQALGIINDNCPINAMYIQQYKYDNQLFLGMNDYFVGRYGEKRCCDVGIIRTAKYNGTGIDIDPEYFVLPGMGQYEFTVVNPNVEVDDLPGHNTTTVYFDQNQEDMTPPSIEMLHFRSAEGVTDRFATAADGTMEFYAGDFNFQHMPTIWSGYTYEGVGVFECQPVEVTVEYAPYGTEEWNELAVEEIPELYQEPGWGYFYRGSLAGVTGEGLNGWFDLRFRLQDASGNWMDQVVSPAFRIDDQAYSSVATVGSDNARELARYNLAGQRVNDTHHGVTIVRMSDGTARKVIQ